MSSRPWAVAARTVVSELGSDATTGLTAGEAARRLAVRGPNELPTTARPATWRLAVRQLANTMTLVLAAAAVVTLAIGERKDTVAIAVIVVLNATVGFVQEHRAEQAMAALRQLTAATARVVRDGVAAEVPAADLVPGDVVRLATGDVVPADLRLLEVHGLRVDESTLTGESEPTAKTALAAPAVGPSRVADRRNMAFKGTVVSYGRGTGIAVATGMATELGAIATLLQAHGAGPTPLQRRLAVLGRRLAVGALAVCAIVFTTGVAAGERADDMFLTAVSLAVAAIPEGLPAVVTVALALGARRMAARRALVRRLPAVETLGSVTVICTDKTGTLTQNRMMVERVWTPVGEHVVSGRGYAPDGEVDASTAEAAALTRVGRVAAACNDASLHAPTSPGGEWTITGDPTEGALLAFAAKVGVERGDLDAERPRRAEIGFDASRRRMTTAHHLDGGCWVATKGALGALRPLLHADEHDRAVDAARAADRFAADGYRVLALAERTACALPDPLDALERDLHLVGIVAITDPPRPEARDAIATCRAAGITPVMITGDHPSTARAIARRVGLIDDDEAVLVTGDELDALDDAALAARVADVRVFARTDPAQKLRIVDAWKARGATVAMTGDGVNDAPALRRADIGVAMGITGTEVSREAADMVLADDDFATIVGAVEEGRRIGDNIRRFVRYMLATNSGEVFVMFLAPLVGLPVPLTPAQILWINLVTDGPPAVALGLEPVEPDAMVRPPRPPDEPVLTRDLWQRALGVGLLMAAVAIGVQAVSRAAGWPARTMVFTTLALLQLGNALAVRSDRTRHGNPWLARAVVLGVAAQLAAVYVPGLRELFDATPLTGLQLLVAVAASTTVYVVVRSGAILRRMRPSGADG